MCVNGTNCRYGNVGRQYRLRRRRRLHEHHLLRWRLHGRHLESGQELLRQQRLHQRHLRPRGRTGRASASTRRSSCVTTIIPCTNDSCSTTAGCQYTDNNTAACTDNDPCTDDRCTGGACVGTPKVCPSTDCTTGTCSNGTCGSTPKNVNGVCDDGLNVCSATGRCSSAGVCAPQNDACGPLAQSCTTCTAGTAGCFNGRLCTCRPPAAGQPPNILVNGVCVQDTNECNANPCAPGADLQRSDAEQRAQRRLRLHLPRRHYRQRPRPVRLRRYQRVLAARIRAVSVPASTRRHLPTATPAPVPRATCRSRRPAPPVRPACAISAGTFATVLDTAFTYPPIYNEDGTILAIEGSPATGVVVRSWSIRHHTVSPMGQSRREPFPAAGSAPPCVTGRSTPLTPSSNPIRSGAGPRINAGFPTITHNVSGVVPGGQYLEPESVALQGITLHNPAGAWPPCRQCVGLALNAPCTCPGRPPTVPPFTVTVTNPATWVDTDGDGPLGMTTHDVSRGGELINGDDPDPPIDYTQPSECPRLTPSARHVQLHGVARFDRRRHLLPHLPLVRRRPARSAPCTARPSPSMPRPIAA